MTPLGALFPLRAPHKDEQVRLICLPYAGGNASVFGKWALSLPGVDVCALELAGHGRRFGEPLESDMERLADGLVNSLAPLFDRPIVLFGHSLGARLGFQLALREARVGSLIASGARPPFMPLRLERSSMPREDLVRELERMGAAPAEVLAERELMDKFILPMVRADFKVAEYCAQPEARISCPIHVVIARDDPEVVSEQAAGWRSCTTGAMTLAEISDGGHFFVRSRSEAVLAKIRAVIDAVK